MLKAGSRFVLAKSKTKAKELSDQIKDLDEYTKDLKE